MRTHGLKYVGVTLCFVMAGLWKFSPMFLSQNSSQEPQHFVQSSQEERKMPELQDNSKWMEMLPEKKQNSSVQSLALPGSHDSCSFSLRKDLEISPSESIWLKRLAFLFPKTVKSIVYNWSVTQTYNIYQQLSSGIRYLDLRVAKRPKDGQFRIVHGLYGATLTEIVTQIKTFLDECQKEIVLLDFNHFYNMETQDHVNFSNYLKKTFGSTMRPPGSLGVQVTLRELWQKNQNVMIFYDNEDIIKNNSCFWSDKDIYSPWADTGSLNQLLTFLENETRSKLPPKALHVSQGLLSPNAKILLRHLTSTLKDTLSVKATKAVTNWLSKAVPEEGTSLNVVIVDFVETQNFTDAVIQRNYLAI